MLNRLSYRIKTPIALVLVILVTTVSVSALLVWHGYADARQGFIAQALSLGRVLARTLRPAVQHDDIWLAFETLRTPLEYADGSGRDFVLLDRHNRVFAASDPRRFPVQERLATLPDDIMRKRGADHREGRVFEQAGDNSIYVLTPVLAEDGAELGLLIQRYDTALLKPRFLEIAQSVVLSSLPALFLLLPLGWLAGKRLAEPLSHLAECLSRVGRESPETIQCEFPPGSDEVSQLAHRFNDMLEELRSKQALEKHLAQSDRLAALGRLAAGIAHEVNNPLGGMLNAISNRRRAGDVDTRTEKTLSLVERGLTQIRSTVSALLVEARLESRALTPADVEDLRTLIAADVQAKRLILDWANGLTEPLPLPSAQVRQILLNLLLNAVHAAPAGGQVSVGIGPHTHRLVLRVDNDGPAIPARRREHLFEPFFSEGEGHGLGLWMTYQLVRQLQGEIEVDSQPGHTRFTVTLPLDENDHVD
ncbi:MAG: sensor histidine kinase [Thiobacillaceae bacterium]